MNNPNDFFVIYSNAILLKDKILMKSIYKGNICLFDVWNSFSTIGKSSLSVMIDNWFVSIVKEKVNVMFSNIETLTDTMYAFSNCIIQFHAFSEEGNELRHIKERMTICLNMENNEWLVLNSINLYQLKLILVQAFLNRRNYLTTA